MKRTPLRRRTPLRSRGQRAYRESDALARFRAEVHARRFCELDTPACPPGRHEGHHAHHVQMRSQGGGHDPSNGLLACWAGHRYVHANPAEAYENGWLRRAS